MDATDGDKTPNKMSTENSYNLQETPQTMSQPESSLQLLETQPAKEPFRFTFASPIRVQFTERRSILQNDPMHVDGSVSLNLAEDIALPPIFQNKNKELQQPETVCLVPEANRPQVKKNDLQRNDDQTQEKEENESKDLHIKHVQPDMDVQTVNDEQLVSSFANGNLKIAVEALISLSSSPNTVQAQEVSTAQGDMQERSEQEKTVGEDLHEQPDVQTVNIEEPDIGIIRDIIDLAKESSPDSSECQDLYVMGVQPALDCQTVIVEITDSGSYNNELNSLASSSSAVQPQGQQKVASDMQERSEQKETEGKDLHEQPDFNVQTVDVEMSDDDTFNNDNVELASSSTAVQITDLERRWNERNVGEDFLIVAWPRDSIDRELERLSQLSPMASQDEALYEMGVQPALDVPTVVVEVTDSGNVNNELNSLASSSSDVQPEELLLPSNNDIGKNTTGQPTKKWIKDIMSYVGVAPERRYTISAVNETASIKRRHCSSNPSEEHQKDYESFIKDLTALLKKRTLRSCNISSYKQIIPTIPKRVKARQSGTVAPRRSKRLLENIQEEVESTEEAARPPKRRRQNEVMGQDSPPTTSRNLRSSTTNTAEVPKKPVRPKKKTAQVPKKPGRPKKKPAQVPKKPGRPKKNK